MNNGILEASYHTLSKSKNLILSLSNAHLCNDNIPPYNSSIGSHVRHILDFYKCVFDGVENGHVDLTNRDRNVDVETDCDCALDHIDKILDSILTFKSDMTSKIAVTDDLGQGTITIDYTIGALLAQANSHTIHHYAIINYILDRLGIVMDDSDFGLNPTSPKKELRTH